jgi:DNA-binding NarL/FixJ family response regulator
MSSRPRILIADDHNLVADLCKQLLEPEFDVIGILASGADLVRAALQLKPDAILVDIAMPVLNGIDAAAQIKPALRAVKIVYLTMNSDPELALHALDHGGSGYLLKTCAASELVIALRTVLAGKTYVASTLKTKVQELQWERKKPLCESDRLTKRQREVLQLLVQGKGMKEVSGILDMTCRTVAFHKYRIMAALGATSNADLVKYAVRNDMIPVSEVPAKTPSTVPKEVGSIQVVA